MEYEKNCRYSLLVGDHSWKEYESRPSIDKERPRGPYCTKCLVDKPDLEHGLRLLEDYLNCEINAELSGSMIRPIPAHCYSEKGTSLSRISAIDTLSEQESDLVLKHILRYEAAYRHDERRRQCLALLAVRLLQKCSNEFLLNKYSDAVMMNWQILPAIHPEWLSITFDREIIHLLLEKSKSIWSKDRYKPLDGYGTADSQGCWH